MIRFNSASVQSINEPWNGHHSSESKLNVDRLDFRIACEEDTEDLLRFLNYESCAATLECAENEEQLAEKVHAFRKINTPRLTINQILDDLCAPSANARQGTVRVRWLLLETRAPEENIVGAARLKQHPEQRGIGLVDLLATIGKDTNDTVAVENTEIRMMLLRQLIRRSEQVAYNSNFSNGLVVKVPQWRTDIITALGVNNSFISVGDAACPTCGYKEIGGSMWPAEDEHMLLKPTMIFDFRKEFTASASTSAYERIEQSLHPLFNRKCTSHQHIFYTDCDDSVIETEIFEGITLVESDISIEVGSQKNGCNDSIADSTTAAITASLEDWSSSADRIASGTDQLSQHHVNITTGEHLDLDLIDRTLLQLVSGDSRTVGSSTHAGENAVLSPSNNSGPLEDENLLRVLFSALHAEYDNKS